MSESYVHGYTMDEARRLADQADVLADRLHAGVHYPPGSRILEVGCGVGAQTVHLARNNPRCAITAVDVSTDSLAAARRRLAGSDHVSFAQADLFDLPFPPEAFDHLFPRMVDGFTRNTFNAMVAGVEARALHAGLSTPEQWRAGMQGLEQAAAAGTAFYCFFRAHALRDGEGHRAEGGLPLSGRRRRADREAA
jgi:SAM-dependent methyltransferase